MPKLLQINVTANWGSTGKIAESIGACAIKKGWESYIAYGRYYNESQSQLLRIGSSLDTYWHYGVQRIFDNEGLCSKRATRQLIAEIKRIAPDIIQLHNIHDHYLNYQVLFEYLNATSIKVVWTFHDCWAFTGHCFHFVHSSCEKWKTGCSNCPQRNKLRDNSDYNYKLKRSLFTDNKHLTIVPVSQWMADFVQESFFRNNRICVIRNGVDLNIFMPKKSLVSKNYKVLAVSNVWHQSKGLYDVIKLRKLLPQEFDLTIVGLSEAQLKTLPTGIKGIQRTQDIEELVRLYSESDVLINPTYADTFPTVNIESLACGTPVITYKTGGSPEAIDKKTGVVVPQGDVKALADAILRMKEHSLSSVDCRRRAEALFNKDDRYEDYVKLYESLLGSTVN